MYILVDEGLIETERVVWRLVYLLYITVHPNRGRSIVLLNVHWHALEGVSVTVSYYFLRSIIKK